MATSWSHQPTKTTYKGELMSINKIRSWLYWVAKILGDINAVRKGKVKQRIARRIAGKQSQKLMNRIFK